ncbi:hypothetical protein [Nocardioides marmorisolisilvae]|uniref:Carboxypeptidase regulatory-like domain-containing protein n=1 Tax=Nocardioides marmorisolisilvae TaxID=1542737 RepID=A0A3N0DSL2_9ACTN|nr:hypothetical protein [Nocardioides marmorisolisilvae]RNL78622.1 hypothetical protein EFL95_05915 [Nocardioides marmorisolisilvae]
MAAAAFVENRGTNRADVRPVEVGAWTLDYLGPGFRVQLRVTARGGRGHISAWISPPTAARVFLVAVGNGDAHEEAVVSSNGHFEFDRVRAGSGYRLAFVTETCDRPILTPPFWV